MGAILAALGPLVVPELIKLAEAIFANKGAGLDKLDVVLQWLRTLVLKKLPTGTAQPTDDELRAVIEGLFRQLKDTNQLPVPGSLPAVNVASATILLIQGQVQQLKVG